MPSCTDGSSLHVSYRWFALHGRSGRRSQPRSLGEVQDGNTQHPPIPWLKSGVLYYSSSKTGSVSASNVIHTCPIYGAVLACGKPPSPRVYQNSALRLRSRVCVFAAALGLGLSSSSLSSGNKGRHSSSSSTFFSAFFKRDLSFFRRKHPRIVDFYNEAMPRKRSDRGRFFAFRHAFSYRGAYRVPLFN